MIAGLLGGVYLEDVIGMNMKCSVGILPQNCVNRVRISKRLSPSLMNLIFVRLYLQIPIKTPALQLFNGLEPGFMGKQDNLELEIWQTHVNFLIRKRNIRDSQPRHTYVTDLPLT